MSPVRHMKMQLFEVGFAALAHTPAAGGATPITAMVQCVIDPAWRRHFPHREQRAASCLDSLFGRMGRKKALATPLATLDNSTNTDPGSIRKAESGLLSKYSFL